MWASPHKACSTPQRPHPILRWTSPQRPSSPSTIGNLQSRGTHPQPNWRLSRSPQSWGTHPQLNWRLPRTPQPSRVKDPRVTIPQTFTSTNPRGESKPMQPMQMARAQVLKSFTLKFQQSNKCLWGNKRGRTKKPQRRQILHSQIPPQATNAYGEIRESKNKGGEPQRNSKI